MKKLCIFDLDGTLTNTITAISYFGNSALADCGFPTIEENRYKRLVGNGRDVLIHRMLGEFNADTEENFKNVCAAYDGYYEADPNYKTEPYKNIPELLKELKNKGILISVLSNKPDNVAKPIVKLFFGDIFDSVNGEKSGVMMKPSPEGALAICRELGVSVSDSVFIGDTNVDIKTGKSAGMETIGVLWGFRDEKELKDAGADYIVNNPLEIVDVVLK